MQVFVLSSKGVLAGIILSAIFFAAKISKVKVTIHSAKGSNRKIYHVSGQFSLLL
ncbi:hypothetical protein [Neobacillus sp. 204]|uniref:hypothetical protein n=1 Tax=Neobacillus sp. 204 TaxID=3383351 RepID=UPI00397CF24F